MFNRDDVPLMLKYKLRSLRESRVKKILFKNFNPRFRVLFSEGMFGKLSINLNINNLERFHVLFSDRTVLTFFKHKFRNYSFYIV